MRDNEQAVQIEMLKMLMPQVPNGYFAVQPDSETPLRFVRISTPKTGVYKGTRKVQTQHGENLIPRAIVWPSGEWRILDRTILDTLILLVVNYKGAAREYARQIGKCCRCNAALTDEISRHYGIGPECVKSWPWMIEEVDMETELANS